MTDSVTDGCLSACGTNVDGHGTNSTGGNNNRVRSPFASKPPVKDDKDIPDWLKVHGEITDFNAGIPRAGTVTVDEVAKLYDLDHVIPSATDAYDRGVEAAYGVDTESGAYKIGEMTGAIILAAMPVGGMAGAGARGEMLLAKATARATAIVKASRGGAGVVRIGQAGEAAVRGAFDIGPKVTRTINGRTRIFDGMTDTTVSEVKNAKYQGLTRQIQDYIDYSQKNDLRFDLFVRPDTNLSGPLQSAIAARLVNLRYIP